MGDGNFKKLTGRLQSPSIVQRSSAYGVIAESPDLLRRFLPTTCQQIEERLMKEQALTGEQAGELFQQLVCIVRGLASSSPELRSAASGVVTKILGSSHAALVRALMVVFAQEKRPKDFIFELLVPFLIRTDTMSRGPLRYYAGEAVAALLAIDHRPVVAMKPISAMKQYEESLVYILEHEQVDPDVRNIEKELSALRGWLNDCEQAE